MLKHNKETKTQNESSSARITPEHESHTPHISMVLHVYKIRKIANWLFRMHKEEKNERYIYIHIYAKSAQTSAL